MNAERIKEIQKETAYPDSLSVQQALFKVWNECKQPDNKFKEDVAVVLKEARDVINKIDHNMHFSVNKCLEEIADKLNRYCK